MRRFQQTIAQSFTVTGVGLHSGLQSEVTVSPGLPGTGIVLRIRGGNPCQIQDADVIQTPRCTRLADDRGNHVDTPEHLFAALSIAGIDNCLIEFATSEVPILDGSAQEWLSHVSCAGIQSSRSPLSAFQIGDSHTFEVGNSLYEVAPGPLVVSVSISFDHPVIGCQSVCVAQADFQSLASARTFVLKRDIERLRTAGLALGGSLDNAVVVSDHGVLNPGGFRFPDECARHKALDLIGDLYVLGAPVIGNIKAIKPSHAANAEFAKQLHRSQILQLAMPHQIAA